MYKKNVNITFFDIDNRYRIVEELWVLKKLC